MANVADRIVETLEAANVRRIFGLVGDSLNGITESLRVREKIEWIPVRHEEVAAFAAGAEAQLTGDLAVCAGSCGPGNLHLINGLFDCHRNRVPVLAIAAHIPSTEIGSSYFQETHPQSLFKECSHYVELISDPLQVPRIVETAIREAVAKQGVAVIVISGDVALKEAGPRRPLRSRCRDCLASVRPRRTSRIWSSFLDGGERTTILCGAGLCRCPRCGGGPRSQTQGAHRARASWQRTHRMGQSLRCGHDGTRRILLRISRHGGLRYAAHAGHGFPLSAILSDEGANRADRHSRREPGPPLPA